MTTKAKIISLLGAVDRKGMGALIATMEGSDFFTAPASTKYHLAYEGGLADHSLNVHDVLSQKNLYLDLGLAEDTVRITSLLHDLCKMDTYVIAKAWRKDANNKWEQYDRYEYREKFPVGHGEKSVMLLQQYIRLTPEELVMIRWHMGGYEPRENYGAISNAWGLYKAAVALHTADLEATYFVEHESRTDG